MIPEAIRAVLLADGDVRAALTTYEFTTGLAAPAVFTTDVLPKDASLPAVIIVAFGGGQFDCFAKRGAEVRADVTAWFDKEFSGAARRAVGWTLWKAINRADLTLPDFEEVGVYADAPAELVDSEGFYGINISVMVRAMEA